MIPGSPAAEDESVPSAEFEAMCPADSSNPRTSSISSSSCSPASLIGSSLSASCCRGQSHSSSASHSSASKSAGSGSVRDFGGGAAAGAAAPFMLTSRRGADSASESDESSITRERLLPLRGRAAEAEDEDDAAEVPCLPPAPSRSIRCCCSYSFKRRALSASIWGETPGL